MEKEKIIDTKNRVEVGKKRIQTEEGIAPGQHGTQTEDEPVNLDSKINTYPTEQQTTLALTIILTLTQCHGRHALQGQ